jgi:hypothetical protein
MDSGDFPPPVDPAQYEQRGRCTRNKKRNQSYYCFWRETHAEEQEMDGERRTLMLSVEIEERVF